MSVRSRLSRIAAMDRNELRVRTRCATRMAVSRVRFAAARPSWRRGDVARLLDPAAGPSIDAARACAARGDFLEAHRLLGEHFSARSPRWPLAAVNRVPLVSAIRERFPAAGIDARDRADRIVEGRFDLLGYHDRLLGNPPDWHADVVHGRRAPRGFWSSIPYLDPSCGDHKVIWEVNRHQHFLALGVAWWLTGHRRYRETFIAHLEHWLRANPPLDGVAWASMLELAFRSLSWTWAVELFSQDAADDDTPWLVDLLAGLDRQLAHVEQNLSSYFSPNTHLTGEALALYAVSLGLPELRSSAARAAKGREILIREADAQIREDGGHAELSSHYHRYSTEFYLLALLVARRTGDAAAPAFERAVRKQAAFLRTIADDRGKLPNIGDDDGGQLFRFGGAAPADTAATLSALAAALGEPPLAVAQPTPDVYWILGDRPPATVGANGPACWPSRVLVASGYFVSRTSGGHLVFDAGPHGFLNGGHAHADALSVVLSVGGTPLFVDPGTATYTMDAGLRDRFRSPTMHNTLTIDGRAFALPRGPFHWARTADARLLTARVGGGADFAVGSHDGYGFPLARAVLTLPGSGWLVVDTLAPPAPVAMEARWHLHPSWNATAESGGFALTHVSGRRLFVAMTAADTTVGTAPYSPAYGRVEETQVLRSAASACGPTAVATFVPAVSGRRPLVLVTKDDAADEGWTRWLVAVKTGEDDMRITLAFPRPLEAEPPPGEWPQPCIELLRASCVE